MVGLEWVYDQVFGWRARPAPGVWLTLWECRSRTGWKCWRWEVVVESISGGWAVVASGRTDAGSWLRRYHAEDSALRAWRAWGQQLDVLNVEPAGQLDLVDGPDPRD